MDKRLVYPFIFDDTLGVVYIKRGMQDAGFNDIEVKWFLSLSEEVSIALKILNLFREEQKIMESYVKYLTRL